MDQMKQNMTDEERLALAAKLDKELDEFIDGLEKRKYTDGWNEDTWEEEMDRHPFFMKQAPDEQTKLDPLTEGLQNLKYDPNENTAEELALNFKEDGNFYVKHKKYRMAILSYTEAIKTKCGNTDLEATLYNNRSAAQFFLKNYRSSLNDAEKALKLKSDYLKAKIRAAQCANFTNKYDLCFKYCDEILLNDVDNKQITELRKSCQNSKIAKERDERKRAAEEKRKIDKSIKVLNEIKQRKIKFEGLKDLRHITEHHIEPRLAPLVDFPVSLDENKFLQWPVVFCYPEFLTTDFQQQLNEYIILKDCLAEMFQEPLEYDKKRNYRINNLNVYYENRLSGKVHLIDLGKTIKEITEEEFFYFYDGCITLHILAKDTEAEDLFVNQVRTPVVINC